VQRARSSSLPGPTGLGENLRLLRRLLDEPVPVLEECATRFGRSFTLGAGPARIAVVGDPARLADVFAEPSTSYRWGHALNVIGFIVGPTSLIVSDGDDHHRRRSAVQPAFARRQLDGWIPMIAAEADRTIDERLAPALDRGASSDLYPVGKDLVLAITVKAFFGNGLEHRTREIAEIFDELQAYLELPAAKQVPHRIPGTRRARARSARRRFDQLVDREVDRRRSLPPGGDDGGDLLDVFVDAGVSGLSGAEVRDQVNTLIGAGYNTTAATLAWTLHRALATPGVWPRLRAEADAVLGAGPVDPRSLHELRYSSAVVHEALRLHPAGAFAPRVAVADVAVGDAVIRRRTAVLWSPYLAGRDPSVWEDPLQFDPDRHLDPAPVAQATMDSAWVPFGKGPRRCIGFALAQMELTLILARWAQRLDLSLVRPETPAPYGMVVNRPRGGVWVTGAPAPGAGPVDP
jgi:cytochrome P450